MTRLTDKDIDQAAKEFKQSKGNDEFHKHFYDSKRSILLMWIDNCSYYESYHKTNNNEKESEYYRGAKEAYLRVLTEFYSERRINRGWKWLKRFLGFETEKRENG